MPSLSSMGAFGRYERGKLSHFFPQSTRHSTNLRPGRLEYQNLLDELEDVRRKYQLKPWDPIEEDPGGKVEAPRVARTLTSRSSLRSTFTLRQRIVENQKQKSFLAITRWALCDARKFHEKVTKLKSLIDGLENISKAIEPSVSESSVVTMTVDENPPYSLEPTPQPPNLLGERSDDTPSSETATTTHDVLSEQFLPILAENNLGMERFLSVCPDDSSTPRPKVRRKLLALTAAQFKELSHDVHDELIRRQRHDISVPTFLPPNPSFHAKRNTSRKQLSTIVHFPHLVSDMVFEFERRLRVYQDGEILTSNSSLPSSITSSLSNPRRWGVAYPPPLLRYRPAHHSTSIDSASLNSLNRDSVSLSSFYKPHGLPSTRNPEQVAGLEPNTSYKWEGEGRLWPMGRVLSWLVSNGFSNEWQKTFNALDIQGAVFLELGNSFHGGAHTGTMHLLVYPRLAVECASSGKDWDEANEREEGKRLRRCVRRILFPAATPQQISPTPRSSNASVEIFKSFRVSMEDPTYKILPAALRKYNINAPSEQYALYIVYGDEEHCLEMDEKPLILFKQLDREGKKPMFLLRKIASSIAPVQ